MWTPGDFLLRSEFCPPDQIHNALKELRKAARCDWLWLVSFTRAAVVPALSFREPERTPDAGIAEHGLRKLDLKDGEPIESELAKMLQAVLGDHIFIPFPESSTVLKEGSVGFWLVVPPGTPRPSEEKVIGLAEMLGGTLIANSLRDGRISELILDAVEEAEVSGNLAMTRLVRLAVETSGVDGAMFYRFEPYQDGLVLEMEHCAESTLVTPLPELIPLERLSEEDSLENGPREAFRRSRTILETFDGARLGNDPSTPGLQIAAVPAPLSPFGGIGRNAGVLVAWRRVRDGRSSVSWFDVALLRNVALRIALLDSNSRLESSALELAQVVTQLANSISRTGPARRVQRRELRQIPADIAAAASELELVIDHLWKATRCDSVTMRILVPAFDGPRRFYLRRIIARPENRLTMEPNDLDVVRLNDDHERAAESANAYAARKGPVHIRDSDRGLHDDAPDLLRLASVSSTPPRSEVSVPVHADGMLVGTINLESSYPNTFIDSTELIAAFAATAGLIVAIRRREEIRAVHNRYSPGSDDLHQQSKISRLLSALDVGLGLSDEVQSLLEGIRSPDRESTADIIDVSFRDMLVAEVAEVGTAELKIAGNLKDQVLARYAPSIREVVREIIANIRRHSDSEAPAFVSAGRVKLVSGRYVVVFFRSVPLSAITNAIFLRTLYRVPVPDRDGRSALHLGCFTAGERVRALGGNIFAGVSEAGVFETQVLLPEEVFV